MRINYLINSVGGFIRLTAESPKEVLDLEIMLDSVLIHYSAYGNCAHAVWSFEDDDGLIFVDICVIDNNCIERFGLKKKFQEESEWKYKLEEE